MGSPEERRLTAIMFTDMVGYSTLSQRNEALAQELLEEHREVLRAIFPPFRGTEIKTIGDAFLVEFGSALEAAGCAVEIQRTLSKRNHDVGPERRIDIRIGIHLGDVIHRGGDVYGDGVNIASRIEPLAAAGGICVSMDVERQLRSAFEFPLKKVAATELKNISLPMDVYRVVLPWEAAGTSIQARPPAGGKATLAWIAGGLALLATSGWWLLSKGTSPATGPAAGTAAKPAASGAMAASEKSIAVLPFVNMSKDQGDEYLSDGMTEELLNVLAKVKGLRVPGRTASFAFKGRTEDGIFKKVGRELQVDTVLEGSVRKVGGKLRITAQLINVNDGYHLWSETYDADMKDILAVQSDVAQRVVRALQGQLGIDEARALSRTPTQNPEAYRLYLLGRYHFAKFSLAGWTNAIRYFEQALQIDPNFVLAYCGLADTYGWCGGVLMSGKEAWAKEKTLALKALVLDPNLAEANLSLATALFSAREYAESEKQVQRALALNPDLALAYDQYGWTLLGLGRPGEAVEKERKAVQLDPLNPLFNTDLGLFLQMARRYDEAAVALRQALELDDTNALAHLELGWSLHWLGRTAEAMAEFKRAATLDDLPWYLGSLGYAYGQAGERGKAEQILRDLEEKAETRYVSPASRALVYLGLGEKEKALDALELALADEDPMLWWCKSDRLYDSVRGEPRFQAIVNQADAKAAGSIPR